jgi:ribosomal protein S18 acetylase RimI-like enzyme
MVADGETPAPNGPAPIVLGPSYVPEMIRLAQQTNPGPFGPRTHELHVFTDNVSAIALYERLGFAKRKTLRLTVFSRAPGA